MASARANGSTKVNALAAVGCRDREVAYVIDLRGA
jgi:hypothetical protein